MQIDEKLWKEFLEQSGMLDLFEKELKPQVSQEEFEKLKQEGIDRFKDILAQNIENSKVSPVDRTVMLFNDMLKYSR